MDVPIKLCQLVIYTGSVQRSEGCEDSNGTTFCNDVITTVVDYVVFL